MKLGTRIALTSCGVVLAVGLVLAVAVTLVVRERFHQELGKRGSFIVETLAKRSTPFLLAGDRIGLQLSVNELRESDPDLEYAFLLDADGRVAAHTFDGGFPRGLAAMTRPARAADTAHRDIRTEKGLVSDFAVGIAAGRLGTAHVGLGHGPLEAQVRQLYLLIAGITGGVVLVGFLAAVLLARIIARPLGEMTQAASRVGEGRFDQRVPVRAGDEVGKLAQTFNSMVGDLERGAAQQREAKAAMTEQLRLQSLVAEVGIALAGSSSLREMLGRCTDAIVADLGAAFARIWVLDETGSTLVLQASSGLYTHLDGPHGRIPLGSMKVGRIAREKKPHLTNAVPGDPLIQDQEWARREGMVAFAGHPLLAGERTVGVMGVFSRRALPAATLKMLASVADLIATGIERRLAEEALDRSRKFIRRVVDSVDEGFVVLDRGLRIVDANRAYCDAVGLPCEQLLGRPCHEVSHGAERPCGETGEECAVQQVFATGLPAQSQHLHRDEDGGLVHVQTKAFPLGRDERGVATVIETVANVSERFLLEEQRLKSQKLEAVGTLAGGIAHDFNNLLQGVFGYISLAKAKFAGNDAAIDMLTRAEQALGTATGLTNQLLTFSKGGLPLKRRIELGPLVESVVRFCMSGTSCAEQITVEEGLRPVEADEGQLGQVVQNLVINALEAMPQGGTLAVAAGNADGVPPPPLAPGRYVVISVQDTGCGMPPEALARAFDPYFTTKDRGSGLGLATAYSIVRNHGGTIEGQSTPGHGSVFRVWLPAVEDARATAASPPPASPGREAHGDRRRILLMDDEEIVRQVGAEMLAALGQEVEVAAHGEAAVERYRAARAAGRPFDAVILDLTIRGGMGGLETLARLREIDPDVRAIVSSGYSDDAAGAQHLACGFRASLGKPYRIEALREALATVLG